MTNLQADHLIDSGASGSVYRAHDADDPNAPPIALKVLKSSAPMLAESFEREAYYLSKLRHPGLVPIYGFSKTGEEIQGLSPAPCFWMEFVEGEALDVAARAATAEQLLNWLRQCLEALDYLHRQGILHGDIKPANIRIDKAGHARLLDFGFASFTCSVNSGQPAKLKGAIPYLAPELLRGERLAATDLYALGTVFYETLAGKHPRYGAKNIQDLFAVEFPSLANCTQSLPTQAAKVIDRMIMADLDNRFKSAADVLQALDQGFESKSIEQSFHSFSLLGRDSEWQSVLSFVEPCLQESQGAIVLVHGRTGVGKTRFTQELFFHFALAGHKVVQGHPEHGLPLLSEENARVVMIRRAEELRPVHLRELYQLNQRIVFLEYNDDRLDPSTAHFFAQLRERSQVLDVPLASLDQESAEAFIKSVLKTELTPGVLTAIFERTQGNPELLTQLAKELVASGVVAKKRVTPQDIPEISLSKNLFRRRLDQINDADRESLQLLATATVPIERRDLAATQGKDSFAIGETLNRLIEYGLVKVANQEPEAYLVAQESLRPLLLEALSLDEIISLHHQWIRYWEGRVSENGDVSPEICFALAAHAVVVSDYPERFKWVSRASELYSARGQAAEAQALIEACLQREMPAADREVLLRQLANAYGSLGKFRETVRVIESWFKEFPRDELGLNPVKHALSTAVAFKNLGEMEKSEERLQECLRFGNPQDPHHAPRLARAHSLLGLSAIARDEFEVARQHFEDAHDLVPEETEQKAEIYKHQALLAVQQEDWEQATTYLSLGRGIYEALESVPGCFAIELEAGNLALRLGRLKDVEVAYAKALDIAARSQDEGLLARVYQNLGVLACRKGDYGHALDELEKARELFLFFGGADEQGLNLMQLALAQASVGHFRDADMLLAQVQALETSPDFAVRLDEVVFLVETIRDGKIPSTRAMPESLQSMNESADWDLERRWFQIMKAPQLKKDVLAELLQKIYEQLSDPLKISFEERPDYHACFGAGDEVVPNEGHAMDIMTKLTGITKSLLGSTDVSEVLERIMDAAMELSKAERGFLLVKADDATSPVSGFQVKGARNISKELLDSDDFKVSLSAVQEVIKTGEVLVTDNAIRDQRFQSAESVHELDLKSILVLPLTTAEGVEGVLYLDHSYETDIFSGTDLETMQVFADHAALALQKAQLIAGLQTSNQQLTDTVESQSSELTILKKELAEQRQQLTYEYGEIVGQSPAMLEVLQLVDRLVDTSIPVWIFGESGTGKEMIARALHYKGPRAKAAFVSENCSSLPETLLESELFGHKKGAFTHADRDKKGLLEHADGGTVFLDEIADMSPALQSKLLRFLQEGEIRPLGSNQVIKVDVRVVSASNQDLEALIAEGKFREDLFYRLNGMTVHLPALRERIEDIPLLVQHFLNRQAEKEKREPYTISPDALELLTNSEWQGNVRELENTIRSASLFQVKNKLTPKSFHFKKDLFGGAAPSGGREPKGSKKLSEKNLILKALKDNAYNKKLAAESLGISRRYLYTQLQKHAIPIQRVAMKAFVEEQLG